MRLIKVMFTEWRDAPVAATPSELEHAAARLDELKEREGALRRSLGEFQQILDVAEVASVKASKTTTTAELVNVLQSRIASQRALEAAGDLAQQAMTAHARVGTVGYQVLNDEGTDVRRVVDADGNALPAGAVYGYRVVDTAPVAPAWAKVDVAQEAP